MTSSDAGFPRSLDAAIWVLIGIGAFARLTRYLGERPLWADEATIALIVIERSIGELLVPNAGDPVTPMAFLVATKFAELHLGDGELALRLLPFVAALISIPVFHALAREVLPRREALVALLLFSISEPLIFYSSELKQYSTDVLVAVVISWYGARALSGPVISLPRIALATAVGSIGIWLSIPAIFVCGGVVAALASLKITSEERISWTPVLAIAFVLGASFVAFYFGTVAPYQAHGDRAGWWGRFFPPLALSREALGWYPSTFFGFFSDPLGFSAVGVAAATFVAGLVRLVQRSRVLPVLLLGPLILGFAASLLRLSPFPATDHYDLLEGFYPFFGRVLLFGVPGVLVVLAVGVVLLVDLSSRRHAYLGTAALAVLFATPTYVLCRNIVEPPVIQDMRGLAEQMAQHAERDDLLFTLGYAEDAVEYYALRMGLPRTTAVLRLREQSDVPTVLQTVSSIPREARFWFATVHHPHWPTRNERKALLPIFRRYADDLQSFKSFRGDAHLYRRRAEDARQ